MQDIGKLKERFATHIGCMETIDDIRIIEHQIKEYNTPVGAFLYMDCSKKIHFKDLVSGYHNAVVPDEIEIRRKDCGMYYMTFTNRGIIVKIPLTYIYISNINGEAEEIKDILLNKAHQVIE